MIPPLTRLVSYNAESAQNVQLTQSALQIDQNQEKSPTRKTSVGTRGLIIRHKCQIQQDTTDSAALLSLIDEPSTKTAFTCDGLLRVITIGLRLASHSVQPQYHGRLHCAKRVVRKN